MKVNEQLKNESVDVKFGRMKPNYLAVFVSLLTACVLFGCKKEEPFEYPEEPDNQTEQLIVYFERHINSKAKWVGENAAQGCPGDPNVNNVAFYEIDISRGYATMHLVPNSDSCVLDIELSTAIKSEEVTSRKWEDLTYEFTYSEYMANPGTEFWLSLYYKNLELDLDLAPHIASHVAADVNNGVFKMSFDTTGVVFELNGKRFHPAFDDGSGNHFSIAGPGEQQHFIARLHSEEVNQQSFLEFKYMRISRYGIPES